MNNFVLPNPTRIQRFIYVIKYVPGFHGFSMWLIAKTLTREQWRALRLYAETCRSES